MSGLPHGIGDAEYGGTRAGEAVEWPTIGQGDREFAHVSVRLTAWHRGVLRWAAGAGMAQIARSRPRRRPPCETSLRGGAESDRAENQGHPPFG